MPWKEKIVPPASIGPVSSGRFGENDTRSPSAIAVAKTSEIQ